VRAVARIRVEYVWDDEVKAWGFAVPALHIVGGGGPNRADAVQRAREAIVFALEDLAESDESGEAAETEYLDVAVG
jgi:hypothetical protein